MIIIDPNLKKETREEYLRRNLLHSSSVGCYSNAIHIRDRLLKLKKKQKWLIDMIESIIDSSEKVHREMANHRDEIEIYREIQK